MADARDALVGEPDQDFRSSITRSAIAKARKPMAPRQNPTGSRTNVAFVNASHVPVANATAATTINVQQMFFIVSLRVLLAPSP